MTKRLLLFSSLGSLIIAVPGIIAHVAIPFSLETYSTHEALGYTGILLSMVAIFLSIRSHRRELGGSITFGKALLTGLATAGIMGLLSLLFTAATFKFFFDPEKLEVFLQFYQQGQSGTSSNPEEMKAFLSNPWLQGIVFGGTVFLIGVGFSIVFALALKRKAAPTA